MGVARQSFSHHADAVVTLLGRMLPDLKGVYLYGSLAIGRGTAGSDVDLAVLCGAPVDQLALFDARQQCESLLRNTVDLVDLRKASTVLQREILKDGNLLHGNGDSTVAAFEVFILRSYEDLQIRRRELLRDIVHRGTVYA